MPWPRELRNLVTLKPLVAPPSGLRVTKSFSFLDLVVYYMYIQHNLHMHPTILSSNIEGTISGLSFVPPVVSGTSMLKGSYQEQCYPNTLMHIYQCYP